MRVPSPSEMSDRESGAQPIALYTPFDPISATDDACSGDALRVTDFVCDLAAINARAESTYGVADFGLFAPAAAAEAVAVAVFAVAAYAISVRATSDVAGSSN